MLSNLPGFSKSNRTLSRMGVCGAVAAGQTIGIKAMQPKQVAASWNSPWRNRGVNKLDRTLAFSLRQFGTVDFRAVPRVQCGPLSSVGKDADIRFA